MKLKLQAYKIFYNPGNINNRKIHIRAFVDDYVVLRTWNNLGKVWHYEIQHMGYFEYANEIGALKEVK